MSMQRSNSSLMRAHSLSSLGRLLIESEVSNGPAADGQERDWLFRLAQTVVIIFRLFTPLAYVILLLMWLLPSVISPETLGGSLSYNFLMLVCVAEACFFPYYYVLFTQVNQYNKKLQHFAADKAVRFQLVKNCFQAMASASQPGGRMKTDPELYIRKVIEGWFLDVPILQIYRGNFASWCGWAFFGKELDNMTAAEVAENLEIVAYVEHMAQWRFPEGFNKELMSARLTLDPVFVTQRPFFFYASIWCVNTFTHAVMYQLGYRRRPEYCTAAANVFHRPPAGGRKAQEQGQGPPKQPIVFVHGIGIGFAHYIGLLNSFPLDVDVYLLEWPHVAMQMARDVPTVNETVDTLLRILDENDHPTACFVAHSLGTTAVSWMLHSAVGKAKVHSTVLLDPVTFLLCDPTVATTFVYREPNTTIDFLMHFFLSRELFISNALSRHFNWSHNIMFVEDLSEAGGAGKSANSNQLPPLGANGFAVSAASLSLAPEPGSPQRERLLSLSEMADLEGKKERTLSSSSSSSSIGGLGGGGDGDSRSSSANALPDPDKLRHTILLSSHDSIVPIGPVSRYLEAKRREGHACFEVVFFHGHHGEMMLYPSWVKFITKKIRERCNLDT